MKQTLLFYTLILFCVISFAQAPEKFSYQAVIRDAGNTLVTNASVGMQISILKGATAVYVETQTPTTNINGLVSLEIGGGTVVSGTFSTIDWSNDDYFIKTETDPSGGASYTITGTSQLLSVPYALLSKDVEPGVFSSVGGLSAYSFVGGNVYYQFGDLTTSITLTKSADVFISYNTANELGSQSGTYFATRLAIDGVSVEGFEYISQLGGVSYFTNAVSGIVTLAAGTYTISVDYRTNVDGNPSNYNNPAADYMTRKLTVKELK